MFPMNVPFQELAGEVMLTLYYLPDSNKLNVSLLKARDLPNREKLGTADPYVKLWLVQRGSKLEKRKTTVKPQTLAPVFNESFTFAVPAKEKLEKEINLVVSVSVHEYCQLTEQNLKMTDLTLASRIDICVHKLQPNRAKTFPRNC